MRTHYARPQPLTFHGKFVQLVPLDIEQHAEALFSISHGNAEAELIWRYLPRGPFPDVSSFREFFNSWQTKPDVVAFAVKNASGESFLGSISVMSIREEHASAELGNIWYAPAAQRTKTNTETCYLLLKYCFDELGYRRMEWKCNDANQASKTAAVRLGFSYEGLFRQHMIVKGLNRDTAWFSIIDSEWPAIRSAMEKWLYSESGVSLGKLIRPETV